MLQKEMKIGLSDVEKVEMKNGIKSEVLTSVAGGSPKGTYADLTALQSAFPNGAPGVYLTTDNGHWYYWNSTAWADGGVYQVVGGYDDFLNGLSKTNDLIIDNSWSSIDNNLWDRNNIAVGFLDTGGIINPEADGWITSLRYIDLRGCSIVTDAPFFYALYDSNFKCIAQGHNASTVKDFVPEAKYIRLSFNGDDGNHIAQYGTVLNVDSKKQIDIIPQKGINPKNIFKEGTFVNGDGSRIVNIKQSENLINYEEMKLGHIEPSDGVTIGSSTWKHTDYYSCVNPGDVLFTNSVNFYSFYDENGVFISSITTTTVTNVTVPNNAFLVRISVNANFFDIYVSRNKATSKHYYNEIVGTTKPIIKVGRGEDYSSLTEALYKTKDSGLDIYVTEGVYDIKQEYINLFGADVIQNMGDDTDLNGFQMGLVVSNRTITFNPASKLVCDWSNYTIDGVHRFSVIMCGKNCKLVNARIEATHTNYIIHDDAGDNEYIKYTQEFIQCELIGHNLGNSQCIGGGCGAYSTHIIDKCYMNNNEDNSLTARYHNCALFDGRPKVYVTNTWFNSEFDVRWHGTQDTTKMYAYVSGCYAPNGIIKKAEVPGTTNDNVELIAWNNTIINN